MRVKYGKYLPADIVNSELACQLGQSMNTIFEEFRCSFFAIPCLINSHIFEEQQSVVGKGCPILEAGCQFHAEQ